MRNIGPRGTELFSTSHQLSSKKVREGKHTLVSHHFPTAFQYGSASGRKRNFFGLVSLSICTHDNVADIGIDVGTKGENAEDWVGV